ncbi:MAG: hypothetical protein QF567_00925 [Candidatus Pacearchaeota archaeon]|nr:hypothetical protein [Candidatus Pacearchaeota archaeon]
MKAKTREYNKEYYSKNKARRKEYNKEYYLRKKGNSSNNKEV